MTDARWSLLSAPSEAHNHARTASIIKTVILMTVNAWKTTWMTILTKTKIISFWHTYQVYETISRNNHEESEGWAKVHPER